MGTKINFKAGTSGIGVEISTELPNDENSIMYGDLIAVRVCDGSYWQVNKDDNNKVMALARHIKEWEMLQIVAVGDEFVAKKNRPVRYTEKVAFRFLTNDNFIGTQLNKEGNFLTANVPWAKEWEMFTLLEHPQHPTKDKILRYGSWFALQSCNSKYVMFDKDSSRQLLACAPHMDEWESFVFMKPPIEK